MRKDIIMLTALSFVLFMLFAQAIPIIDGDSAFYATIAKNIVKSGDWATLKFVNAGDIIDKPPLAMWLTAASFKIFGINEFALSLWQAILGVMTVILTYLMAKDTLGRQTGILAGLILMLSAQFFYIVRTPMLDIPLTFFITAVFYALFKLDRTQKPVYFYLAAVWCALALLTKGPVGAVIPILAYVLFKLLRRRINRGVQPQVPFAVFHFIFSALLFLLIAAPWFIIEYRILGQKFLDIFFLRNFLRFLRPTDVIGDLTQIAPQYDFYSYFLQIFLLMAPWGALVYPALFFSFKKKGTRFFLFWAAVAVAVFAFSLNYKLGRYILPAFPALAILVACMLNAALDKATELRRYILASAWINLILVVPLFTLATIFLIIKFPAEQLSLRPIALPFLSIFSLGLVVGTVYLFLNNTRKSILAFAACSAVAYCVFVTCAALYIDNALPTKTFCLEINKMAKSGDSIVRFAGEDPRQEYFYLDHPLVYIKDINKLMQKLRSKTKLYGITQDKRVLETRAKIIKETSGYYLFSN